MTKSSVLFLKIGGLFLSEALLGQGKPGKESGLHRLEEI